MEKNTNKKFEEINKFLKENQEKAIKQVKEIVPDLKTEIESIKNKHKPKEIWRQKI